MESLRLYKIQKLKGGLRKGLASLCLELDIVMTKAKPSFLLGILQLTLLLTQTSACMYFFYTKKIKAGRF